MYLSPNSLVCCAFKGVGSVVVVDVLFNIPPIVCGSYVLVFVLVCMTHAVIKF